MLAWILIATAGFFTNQDVSKAFEAKQNQWVSWINSLDEVKAAKTQLSMCLIRKGMQLEEVEAILGPSSGAFGPGYGNWIEYIFDEPRVNITIVAGEGVTDWEYRKPATRKEGEK